MMKHVPNMISITRIALSGALALLPLYSMLFMAAYLLCGISDVLDGYIARRFKWESRMGEQLDSLSDFIFHAIVIYLLITSTDLISQKGMLCGIIVTVALRAVNLVITRAKFGTWGMLHSWGNKIVGLFLYIYIAFALSEGRVPLVPGFTLCLGAALSAVEEMFILHSIDQYDANRKSYFMRR